MNVKSELLNLSYREKVCELEVLFPKIKRDEIKKQYAQFVANDPHTTILAIALDLWNGKYEEFLNKYGFWDSSYANFSGHCHQCTPILGAVFRVLGFEVSYLECMRIKEHFSQTGLIEQVPPTEEPNMQVREEFCSIKRIPYCCLEITVDTKKFYVTGKHIKNIDGTPHALLTPICYEAFVGVVAHQSDKKKSGIYLQAVLPKNNPTQIDFTRQVVWMKQTLKDPQPELFATFLRMKLV